MTTLEELLGFDPDSPDVLRAEKLAQADREMIRRLVRLRKRRGFTQKALAGALGITQPSVAALEAYDSNPRLSTLRRYAHAVGALVTHSVEADPAWGGVVADPITIRIHFRAGDAPFRHAAQVTGIGTGVRCADLALAA